MTYPYPPSAVFVTAQPKQYDIHSNFGMFVGERLLYHNKMKNGCCKLGDTYFTTVTDIRYIARQEECICCNCCCTRPYTDQCIYLHDIAELHEVRDDMGCCNWCYKNCCPCCSCLCCCRLLIPKRLQFRGSFGHHMVHIAGKDIPDFELMITEAIAQHKLTLIK